MSKVSIVAIGAGSRGAIYANYIKEHSEEGQIVAICEPCDEARDRLGDEHAIPEHMRFGDWRDILDRPRLADAALICTQDTQHRDPAIALAERGYHLLLEKPMAPYAEDCAAICDAAKRSGVILAVCHVLRYTPFNLKLKEMIDSGIIGGIHNIQLLEPVGYWHQAHSFVRGNWRREDESSPMLLAKACHDLDLLSYFMPSRCKRVSSFGTLSHFTRANRPECAADRCTQCPADVESSCPYSALKIYLRDRNASVNDWPVNVLAFDPTPESVLKALETGPYGRCVYACDNDVVDHQVVNLEYEDGATATFTMAAFNLAAGREIYVMGDKGTLQCTDRGIEHTDFLTNEKKLIPLDAGDGQMTSGHGGGDQGLMDCFLAAVRNNDPSLILSGPDVSLDSHLVVFAAEAARRSGTVVSLGKHANAEMEPVGVEILGRLSEDCLGSAEGVSRANDR